ncbi:MAG: leucine--tRNA ligase [Candidatus Woesearchaeota archaeon]
MVDLKAIQDKWQKKWEENAVFETRDDANKEKFYVLEMYPYPSGYLHMGHVRVYSLGDSFARFKRMRGYNVLYPMGYDSFGLPAENAAKKNGVDPEQWTDKNVKGIRDQQKMLGLSYDWRRMVYSHDPEYYRWNQWVFLKLYEKGLVTKKKALVNWCPKCNTVLANEQVHNGRCWRHEDTDVEPRELEQWYYKTTAYADELFDDIDDKLQEWPESVKIMQKNWIGKSHGTTINFDVIDADGNKFDTISTFTTRPDTVYGITYLVLSAEHPKVLEWTKGTEYEARVKDFIRDCQKKSTVERTAEGKEKNGMFLGRYFINPVNGEKLPLWVADYALMDYGTGAVMAVPAHDQRDFDFAKKYDLPIRVVISPKSHDLDPEKMSRAFTDEGTLVNSGDFDGIDSMDAIDEISDFLEKNGWGEKTTSFKLKDWLISRQRYWGTPIPIVYCEKCGMVPVPEKDLPIKLPKDVDFSAEGNPLETSGSFMNCQCPECGGKARRDTDTMDTFVDSSWYFLRFTDSKREAGIFDKEKADYWMPVDQYIGGIEHACMHLIYARFYTKALRDMGYVDIDEPFKKLLTLGMVIKDGAKMSKSVGNVVDPIDIIENYGSDTARTFILFASLPEKELDWNDDGVEATYRFLKRVFNLLEITGTEIEQMRNEERFIESKANRTIKKVTEHLERLEHSLAIGGLMDFVNDLNRYGKGQFNKKIYYDSLEKLILLISPFAPHLSEEMWERMGKKTMVSLERWPECDESKLDERAEASQDLVESIRKDIMSVKTLAKIENPKKISIIISQQWKYGFVKAMKEILEKTHDPGEMIKELMVTDLKKYGKEISKLVPKIVKDHSKLPEIMLEREMELSVMQEKKEMIEKEFGCQVEILDSSEHPKAGNAFPGKPAIVLE